MARTIEQIDADMAKLQTTVTGLVQSMSRLSTALTSVSVEVTTIKNNLAAIPAPPASLAQIASKLDTITGQLAPLSTHAGKILAVQAGSMGVR